MVGRIGIYHNIFISKDFISLLLNELWFCSEYWMNYGLAMSVFLTSLLHSTFKDTYCTDWVSPSSPLTNSLLSCCPFSLTGEHCVIFTQNSHCNKTIIIMGKSFHLLKIRPWTQYDLVARPNYLKHMLDLWKLQSWNSHDLVTRPLYLKNVRPLKTATLTLIWPCDNTILTNIKVAF